MTENEKAEEKLRFATEFEVTFFGLSDLERGALIDLYADHAYKFAKRHGMEHPLIGARVFHTEEQWDQIRNREAEARDA